LESGYIQQYIEDNPLSPLSTIFNSQKPDVIASKLLEGRVAIICDGTPHVLSVPGFFIENLQTSEDYYIRPILATLLRLLRISAFFISVLLPSLYVALQTFHPEMIPTILLMRMSGEMEDIPFPAFAEALFMMLAFELLRESGTRLPRPVGSAVSIVGALIIGEGAVNAGLVSSTMVIVIAITAVSGFIIPALNETVTLYRFILLTLGSAMGLYGITCGIFVMVTHAISLRSFGVPYTSPLAPFNEGAIKDFFTRFPLWSMKKRPPEVAKINQRRQGNTRKK
jgi:spore germination protein KA